LKTHAETDEGRIREKEETPVHDELRALTKK
jgi:hypothetical protein